MFHLRIFFLFHHFIVDSFRFISIFISFKQTHTHLRTGALLLLQNIIIILLSVLANALYTLSAIGIEKEESKRKMIQRYVCDR